MSISFSFKVTRSKTKHILTEERQNTKDTTNVTINSLYSLIVLEVPVKHVKLLFPHEKGKRNETRIKVINLKILNILIYVIPNLKKYFPSTIRKNFLL